MAEIKNCFQCNKKAFCKQAFKVRRTLDAMGRPYDGRNGTTLYDYVARAYNHSTKKLEVYRGTISVKPQTYFVVAIAANIRGKDANAWLCTGAKQLGA